jgi:hypothetical protein
MAIAVVTLAVVTMAVVAMAVVATATTIAIVTPDGATTIVTPTATIVTPATAAATATDKRNDTGRAFNFQDRYRGRLCRP